MSTAVPSIPFMTVHARRARRLVVGLGCLCALAAWAEPAMAQLRDSEGAEEQARFKWGPLSLNPSVTIPYIGTDSNVFNTPEDPVMDFTFVIAPTADYWLRARRLRLSAQTVVIGEYFKDTENQRSFGGEQAAKLEFGLDRFAPYIEGRYVNSRARPGLEVDLRARRREGRATLGLSVRLSERLEVDVSGGLNRVDHDEAEFFGVDLSQAFNRDGTDGRVRLRYELTPLTTFVVRTEVTRDRFVSSDFRDSEAVRILPGFEFSPSALLSGSAFVGVAQLKTLGSDVRDFAGVIAEVGVGYSGGANRYGLRVRRAPVYSFEPEEPFYVESGLDVTVTRRMSGLRPHVDSTWARVAPVRKARYHRRKWNTRLPSWLCPDGDLREELLDRLLARRTPPLTSDGSFPRSYYRHSLRTLSNPFMFHENETAFHMEALSGLRLLSPTMTHDSSTSLTGFRRRSSWRGVATRGSFVPSCSGGCLGSDSRVSGRYTTPRLGIVI